MGQPVCALAGRRVDALDSTEASFPLANVEKVRESIRALFARLEPKALVCSAACGADLLALDVARSLDVEAHIQLPFSVGAFRSSSVIDRPGEWGALYDTIIKEADQRGLLTVMHLEQKGDEAFTLATRRIIDLTSELAASDLAVAIAVTDGRPRKTHDATAEFSALAKAAGMHICEISTL